MLNTCFNLLEKSAIILSPAPNPSALLYRPFSDRALFDSTSKNQQRSEAHQNNLNQTTDSDLIVLYIARLHSSILMYKMRLIFWF